MWGDLLLVLFTVFEVAYLTSVLVSIWFYTLPVDRVTRPSEGAVPTALPSIVLFYPVLNEMEETMRTTLTGMERAQYPSFLLRVIAIPNDNDVVTIDSLRRLQDEFQFLEVLPVPPTSDPSWETVWSAWGSSRKAYWWHEGKRAGITDLPPKKTRQLIWAMYQVAPGNEDSLLSYIDADSVVPTDYWMCAASGMSQYDVVQHTNIAGNMLSSWPASFYANDHIGWDASMYRHMSAGGRQPFYVLGKGLFFRFSDLLRVGGFHPWLTIEDPEIGMRLWTNGARLGVVESPLVEEVPATWSQGITQRKRWIAGFFQSLASPLVWMGMTPGQRFRARLNFVPCLSLALNPIGVPLGVLVSVELWSRSSFLPPPLLALATVTTVGALVLILRGWLQAWRMSAAVLASRRDRVRYVLRVNPVFVLLYWMWWSIPLVIGLNMFVRDRGLVWERTEKRDANRELVRG
ncbi:glycosyltransferase family 2 protein [Allobranchiibius sp. CTAmp26]|uniref:glycosyltransferase family 2 protein n=1 Tax=Allobranchiibius sp. CTAmp26 TaxID=2815214 RepID=UPI001AA19EE3|nr:glycosyltransferase family 2 protein [Allobranchiibius sp. CTAmp26]MBO1753707.1 glycosyltransferase [Allobranchiibius sp. CTAmp26]